MFWKIFYKVCQVRGLFNLKNYSYFILLCLFSLVGCVGTVQETKRPYSKVEEGPKSTVSFQGIAAANAISDSRIEVFFFPAEGGSGKFTYDIYVGSSPLPVSVPSDVLMPDYRGMLKFTLTGLNRLSSYQIKVDIRDEKTKLQSITETIKTRPGRGPQRRSHRRRRR